MLWNGKDVQSVTEQHTDAILVVFDSIPVVLTAVRDSVLQYPGGCSSWHDLNIPCVLYVPYFPIFGPKSLLRLSDHLGTACSVKCTQFGLPQLMVSAYF